jgi:hypothetical protein
MRESWTDDRLDDFRERTEENFRHVDRRFEQVDKRFDRVDADLRELRGESKALRGEMNERFESLQRQMVYAAIAMTTAMLAGYAALAGLITLLL